jgi:uncharacterized protein DUF4386
MDQTAEWSPRLKARIAGVFYSLTIVFGSLALALASGRIVINLLATACYVAVTLLFYPLFKPANKGVSLLAMSVGLAGCVVGAARTLGRSFTDINPLAFFGVYCLLIGFLILKSTFLPRFLGVLMAFGGVGWLTFVSPSLAATLSPYNMVPGIVGELILTVWLLVKGVDEQRWREQAFASAR